jgi:hypothetical protein
MEARAPASVWDRERFVERRGALPSPAKKIRVSLLLPKIRRILLDNAAICDYEERQQGDRDSRILIRFFTPTP